MDQLRDGRYRRIKRYADSRGMSLPGVCRNTPEFSIGIHSVDGIPEKSRHWTAPICRPKGLRAIRSQEMTGAPVSMKTGENSGVAL